MPSYGKFETKYSAFKLLLTDETVMGRLGSEFGTPAILIAPFGKFAGLSKGPTMSGPLKKKPNTSLYGVFTHVSYSSDPKM